MFLLSFLTLYDWGFVRLDNGFIIRQAFPPIQFFALQLRPCSIMYGKVDCQGFNWHDQSVISFYMVLEVCLLLEPKRPEASLGDVMHAL